MIMKILSKVVLSLLIIAIFLSLSVFLSAAITKTIKRRRLYPGWVRLSPPPTQVAELLTPTDGYVYVRGIDGKIYQTCDEVPKNTECWEEVDNYNPPEPDSCSWAEEMQEPPHDTVSSIVHCLSFEFVIINGVALTQDGEVFGYHGESPGMGSLLILFRTIIILSIISIVASIFVIIKTIPMVDRIWPKGNHRST
jgi:hypothetical protein